MTVLISIARRTPRNWFKRQAGKAKGLMTFQENIWQIIKQSLTKAKKAANADGRVDFVLTNEVETEDLHYQLEWLRIKIQGNEEDEKEEYEDSLQMYKSLSKILKKELPQDESMKSHFKTKLLSTDKVQEMYKQGYGASGDNNIANKLLEMGILTHIEWDKDFDSRDIILS